MPSVTVRTSVPANSTVENVLTGSQFEIMPYNGAVAFAMNQQSGAVGDILGDVYSGQDVLQERGPISAQARFPVNPDDFTLSDVAAWNERLKVRLTNTTAGAIVVITVVNITPL